MIYIDDRTLRIGELVSEGINIALLETMNFPKSKFKPTP
jgi:hypothetical protein